jgi:hypothetical protein
VEGGMCCVVSRRFVSTSVCTRSVSGNWSNSGQFGWCLATFKPVPSPPIVCLFKKKFPSFPVTRLPHHLFFFQTWPTSKRTPHLYTTAIYCSQIPSSAQDPAMPSPTTPAQDRLTPQTASPDLTHALQTAMRLHGVECAHVFGLAYLDAHSCPVSLVSYSPCADACLHSGVWIAHVLGRRYRTEME